MTPKEFKELRLKMGCRTRKQIADLMGMSSRTIEHWEYGRRQIPEYAIRLINCLARISKGKRKDMPTPLMNYEFH